MSACITQYFDLKRYPLYYWIIYELINFKQDITISINTAGQQWDKIKTEQTYQINFCTKYPTAELQLIHSCIKLQNESCESYTGITETCKDFVVDLAHTSLKLRDKNTVM